MSLLERGTYETNKSTSREANQNHGQNGRETNRIKSTTSQDKNTSALKPRSPLITKRDDSQSKNNNSLAQGIVDYQKLSSISNQQRTPVLSKNVEEMKIHRGPLNLNALTMREPKLVYEELIMILEAFGVGVKRSAGYTVKCEYKDLKFAIEINYVEKFSNIFVIKFYKSNQVQENYFDLCTKVFSKLNL